MLFLASFLFLFICYLTVSDFVQKLKKEKEMLTLLFQLKTFVISSFQKFNTFAEVFEIRSKLSHH